MHTTDTAPLTIAQTAVLDVLDTATPMTPMDIKRALPGATPVATIRRILGVLRIRRLADPSSTGINAGWTRVAPQAAADDPWATGTDVAAFDADEAMFGPQDADLEPADGEGAMYTLGHAQFQASAAIAAAGAALAAALDHMAATLQDSSAVEVIAWAQEQRRALSVIEQAATAYATANLRTERTGTLADGRAFEVKRSTVRKAWDHQGWQHDARAAVVQRLLPVSDVFVDARTGELVDMAPLAYTIAAEVQAFHGSTAPKVTAMRAAGLDPDDYCESAPGLWTVTITEPDTVQPNS